MNLFRNNIFTLRYSCRKYINIPELKTEIEGRQLHVFSHRFVAFKVRCCYDHWNTLRGSLKLYKHYNLHKHVPAFERQNEGRNLFSNVILMLVEL